MDEDAPLFLDAPAPFGGGHAGGRGDGAAGARGRRAWRAWCCATAGSTARAPTTPRTARTAADVRRRRFPVVGNGSGAVLVRPRRRRGGRHGGGASSAAPRASTTSSTTSRPRCATGCRSTPRRSGAKPPRRVPVWLARLVAGRMVAEMATVLPGASNARAKRELGWRPAHASWRAGFRESLRASAPACRPAAGTPCAANTIATPIATSVRDLITWPSVPTTKPRTSSTMKKVGETRKSPPGSGPSPGSRKSDIARRRAASKGGESILGRG